MESKFIDNVKSFLKEKVKKSSEERDNTYFHPSEFGACPIYIWFKMTGVQPEDSMDDISARIFDNGHFVHLRHQLYSRDCGYLSFDKVIKTSKKKFAVGGNDNINRIVIHGESGRQYPYAHNEELWIKKKTYNTPKIAGQHIPEFKLASEISEGDEFWLVEVPFLDEKYHFGGHCDAIVIDNGEEAVVDWKGTNDYSVAYLFYNEDKTQQYVLRYPDRHNSICFICGETIGSAKLLTNHLMERHMDDIEVDFRHKIQLHIYMWQFGLNKSLLIHENKNNQKIIDINVPMDDNIIEAIKNRSMEIWECVKDNQMPERLPKYTSKNVFPCRFCDYKLPCWS